MKDEISRQDVRQPYERPQIKVIELVAEEVLAVGCKGPALGTASGAISPPCMIRNCARSGS